MSGLQSQEIFQTVREEYLAHLRQAIDTAKLSRPDLVTELALRVNGEHELCRSSQNFYAPVVGPAPTRCLSRNRLSTYPLTNRAGLGIRNPSA